MAARSTIFLRAVSDTGRRQKGRRASWLEWCATPNMSVVGKKAHAMTEIPAAIWICCREKAFANWPREKTGRASDSVWFDYTNRARAVNTQGPGEGAHSAGGLAGGDGDPSSDIVRICKSRAGGERDGEGASAYRLAGEEVSGQESIRFRNPATCGSCTRSSACGAAMGWAAGATTSSASSGIDVGAGSPHDTRETASAATLSCRFRSSRA